MLNYDGVDISEGTDISKTSASKKCDSAISVTICIFWVKDLSLNGISAMAVMMY